MTDVFISYSRKDKTFVQRLNEALAAKNRQVWVDWEDIPLTADWWAEIEEGIEVANTFVFIISPDSATSEVCRQEIEHAANHNKRIIPIVYRDVPPEDLPETLTHLNWIFCREEDNFDIAFESLLQTMDTDLEWVKKHTRLTQRAVEWDKHNRSDSYVLRGEDLSEVEKMLPQTDKEPSLTKLQTMYIWAGRKSSVKRHQMVIIAVSIGFIVTTILGIMAFSQYRITDVALTQSQKDLNTSNRQRDEAFSGLDSAQKKEQSDDHERKKIEEERDQAFSRELAANAKLTKQTDPELSLLLAIEAVSRYETTEAIETLRQLVQAPPEMKTKKLLTLAQSYATRSWSLEECQMYLHQKSCP